MSIFKGVFNLLTGKWDAAEEVVPPSQINTKRKKDWRWEYRIQWDNKHQMWFVHATDTYGRERHALKCGAAYDDMVKFCHKHAESLKPEEPIYLGKLPPDEEVK